MRRAIFGVDAERASSQKPWISGDLRMRDRIADHLGIDVVMTSKSPATPQIIENGQQRHAENGEVAALHPAEQLHAGPLDPVTADAAGDRRPFGVEIFGDEPLSDGGRTMQPRAIDMPPDRARPSSAITAAL